jgi:hypothetical protein
LTTLTRIELQRSGRASLLSMSPDEFELDVQVVDRARVTRSLMGTCPATSTGTRPKG